MEMSAICMSVQTSAVGKRLYMVHNNWVNLCCKWLPNGAKRSWTIVTSGLRNIPPNQEFTSASWTEWSQNAFKLHLTGWVFSVMMSNSDPFFHALVCACPENILSSLKVDKCKWLEHDRVQGAISTMKIISPSEEFNFTWQTHRYHPINLLSRWAKHSFGLKNGTGKREAPLRRRNCQSDKGHSFKYQSWKSCIFPTNEVWLILWNKTASTGECVLVVRARIHLGHREKLKLRVQAEKRLK